MNLLGNSRNQSVPFRPMGEILKILHHERARADRSNHEFSVILFNLNRDKISEPELLKLHESLKLRLRLIDETGWFNDHQIAIVLPYTSGSNAMKLADDLREIMNGRINVQFHKILCYPSVWPYKNEQADHKSNSMIDVA